MNEEQDARQVRRTDGRRRVRLVTRLVAGGAAAVAVLLGVAFAQESAGDTGTTSDSGTTSTDSGSSSDSSSGSSSDSGTWQAPGSSDSSGSADGSTGAS